MSSAELALTGGLSLGDNVKAKFGDSDDLQIYHDSASGQSIIKESGPSVFKLMASDLRFANTANTQDYISCNEGADVKLTYAGSVKLATTSTGIDVTGSVNCDGFTSTGIDDNATSTAITIDASENVGIGVTPESDWSSTFTALQVGGMGSITGDTAESAGNQFTLVNNAYISDATSWTYKMTDEASFYQQADGQHQWRVAPSGTAGSAISWTTAMTINNSGNIGIGTSSPTAKLHVLGANAAAAVKIIGGSTNGYYNLEVQNSAANGYGVAFKDGGSIVGSITTTGSATSYNTSSDYRLKENVVPMTGSIDRLKELKPSRFNFKADTDKTVDGFLAHEAQEVVPEAVHGTKDAMMDEEYEVTPAVMDGDTVVTEAVMGTRSVPDYQGIDQSKLVPLLVASLQEAVAKIEALEARVTALEV
jgi:hypothetical protein